MTLEGVVERATGSGIRVDGEWYSVSRFAPVELPAAGARVRLVADDKRFLKSLEVLTRMPPVNSAAPARERTIARLTVLKAAAAFAAGRTDIKSSDVLVIADRWLQWVGRED